MANISVGKIETTRSQNGPQEKKDGPRYSSRPHLRWDRHPVSLAALMLMYMYSIHWGTDDQFRVQKPVKDLKYHPDRILEMYSFTQPEIFEFYREKTSSLLTANVVSNRFHKMFYGSSEAGETVKGEAEHCQLSKEHPKQNAFRRKALEIVEERIQQVGWFSPNLGDWDYAPLIELIADEKEKRRLAAKKRRVQRAPEGL